MPVVQRRSTPALTPASARTVPRTNAPLPNFQLGSLPQRLAAAGRNPQAAPAPIIRGAGTRPSGRNTLHAQASSAASLLNQRHLATGRGNAAALTGGGSHSSGTSGGHR